jgi:hypothetical protein
MDIKNSHLQTYKNDIISSPFIFKTIICWVVVSNVNPKQDIIGQLTILKFTGLLQTNQL